MDPETMDNLETPAQPTIETPAQPVETTRTPRARWSRRVLALVAGGALVALTVGASSALASDPAASPPAGAIPADATAADAAFKDFAACMRKNGIDMPDPVTVTSGPSTAIGGPITTVAGGSITAVDLGVAGTTGATESGTTIVVGSGDAQPVPVDDATFKAANAACSPILEAAGINSGTGTIVSGEGTLSAGAANSAGVSRIVAGTGDVTKMADYLKTYAACMRANGVDMPDPVVDTKAGTVQLQFGGDAASATFGTADKACATDGFGLAIPVPPTQP